MMKRYLLLASLCIRIVLVSSFQSFPSPAIYRQRPGDGRWLLSSSPSATIPDGTASQTTEIITPHQFFRTTKLGEVSIVTMNILAPSYNALAVDNWDDRMDFLKQDRTERVPLAIKMAKQHNSDILCLQEVEGGTDDLESVLKHLLAEPLTVDDGNRKLEGYDMFLWASLLPNRADNVVGNCVAWRSSRHKLAAVDCFKRGMVCQMQEIDQEDEGATFCVANVHLPAKPSNVMGRLKSMSHTIQKMTRYDPKVRKSPLDGLFVVAGDFNCDQNSVTAKLLTTGYSPYGNLKDRNYKANVSKASAFMMRHDYRFKDVYEERRDVAPVTVSLTGRGPGCTDHLFFAQNRAATKSPPAATQPVKAVVGAKPSSKQGGKRMVRRQRVARIQSRRTIQLNLPTAMSVGSILATISGPNDTQRLETINNGLPNLEKGFPSDHIPIGALFVPDEDYSKKNSDCQKENTDPEEDEPNMASIEEASTTSELTKSNGVSSSVLKRREAATASVGVKRRHNVVLRCVTEWLTGRGAYDIHRDQPLYKLKFAQGAGKLNKKSRAPDLVCCLGNSLVVIEVTVSGKPDSARLSKLKKYEDLETILQASPSVKEEGLIVYSPFVILLDEHGGIPEETRQDILELARLTSSSTEEQAETDTQRFCNHLRGVFNNIQ